MTYRVVWEIDIDANSPREAAELALATQRREGSHALVFNLDDEYGQSTCVDLSEDEND